MPRCSECLAHKPRLRRGLCRACERAATGVDSFRCACGSEPERPAPWGAVPVCSRCRHGTRAKPRCGLCGVGPANRSRGLCSACYDGGRRGEAPSQGGLLCSAGCGRRQSSNPSRRHPDGRCTQCAGRHGNRVRPEDEARFLAAARLEASAGTGPTDAEPGTAEHLAVLMARAAAGLPLFDRRDRAGRRDAV